MDDRKGSGGPDPENRPSKAERREKARLQRERMQRRAAAKRKARRGGLVAGLIALAVVVVILVSMTGGGGNGNGELPGILTTTAPWPNNVEQMPERLRALNLPAPGEAKHIHVPIWVFIEGEEVTVPQDVGISGATHSPVHMHEPNRTLHVESNDPERVFTLGEFFDVWGVRLDSSCIGGYCQAGDIKLTVFAGGEEVQGDPRAIQLEDQKAIVLTFGTEEQLPDPIPTGFA